VWRRAKGKEKMKTQRIIQRKLAQAKTSGFFIYEAPKGSSPQTSFPALREPLFFGQDEGDFFNRATSYNISSVTPTGYGSIGYTRRLIIPLILS